MLNKRPIVGVMGSGVTATGEAEEVGGLVARLGAHLLTGGGGGQMEAASRSFTQSTPRSGLCLGVIPNREEGSSLPAEGYPNAYLDLVIRTHLWLSGEQGAALGSRNAINVLTSTVIVVLYGNEGTLSELRLAQGLGKPMALYLTPASRELAGADNLIAAFSQEPLSTLRGVEHWLCQQLGI